MHLIALLDKMITAIDWDLELVQQKIETTDLTATQFFKLMDKQEIVKRNQIVLKRKLNYLKANNF
jgi:hypothetical protein